MTGKSDFWTFEEKTNYLDINKNYVECCNYGCEKQTITGNEFFYFNGDKKLYCIRCVMTMPIPLLLHNKIDDTKIKYKFMPVKKISRRTFLRASDIHKSEDDD